VTWPPPEPDPGAEPGVVRPPDDVPDDWPDVDEPDDCEFWDGLADVECRALPEDV
jgi:hypothetical protein